jgi:LacI family transcriptional regulator, repressor for deo operon, udp, cdd, tsx, nupC, and nupG
MARPTINDVATAAGVSKGAVSFALNDKPGISAGTRARILAVAEELGWTPSPRARALSVSKALAVGLVVARAPEVLRADAFFPAFIAGAETVLSEHGHALLLQVAEHDDAVAYRRLAAEGRVDGVLVTDLQVHDPRPALLAELGLPAVVVGPASADHDAGHAPVLGVDDAPGIEAAVQHLVQLGHRRIAHVAGPQTMVHGRSRRTAWSNALRSAGLPEGPLVEADFSAESGAAATRTLLDLDDPPTAVVYANDLMAMAGLSLAAGRGVDVPRQLSVTGFDDIEISAHLQPALTTVSTDVVAWGRAAATRLLQLIHRRPTPPIDLPPARLVVRDSTASPRTAQ